MVLRGVASPSDRGDVGLGRTLHGLAALTRGISTARRFNKRHTFEDVIAATEHVVAEGLGAPGAGGRAGGVSAGGLMVRCVRDDAAGPVRQRRRRGPIRRRRVHDERPVAAARSTMGRVGRPGRALRQLHARLLAVRDNTGPADYPAPVRDRRSHGPRVYLEPAKWVARLRSSNAGVRPPTRPCAPRWAPATAAPAAATDAEGRGPGPHLPLTTH